MRSIRFRPARLLVIATTVTVAVSTAAAQSVGTRSFLWKVQSATGVMYLAGSVHALDASVYPLNPAFERAFEASDALVEEIDMAEMETLSSVSKMLSSGMFRDGRTFNSVVSPETARLVAERFKDTPGMTEALGQMKPWMVNLLLSALLMQEAGLDPALGLDKHFYDKAKAAGKPIVGLETAQSQINRMDRLPMADQDRMLLSTLQNLKRDSGPMKTIVDYWRRGNATGIERLVLEEFQGYPTAYASLIVERNRNWMPQMDACLARRTACFVVVGAAHIVGPDGLLALLQRKGYRVEQQ
jgi:uncharacterized protein YbaP (TraB family)